MAVIDLAGFVADLKDHAVEHGFHVHDERHFVESYSLRQTWEVDLHPEEGCEGPVDLYLSLEIDPRVLLGFEDAVIEVGDDAEPADTFHFPLSFTWALPPLAHGPDLLVLATDLAGVGGRELPLDVSATDSFPAATDAPERSLRIVAHQKVSVGPPFYDMTFVPIMVPLLIAMAVGPMLPWKRGDLYAALSRLKVAFVVTAAAALVTLAATGAHSIGAACGLALAAWLFAATMTELAERVRLAADPRGALRRALHLPRATWGMILAHGGMAVVIAGITGSNAWTQERIVDARPGDQIELAGYTVALDAVNQVSGPDYTATRADMRLLRNDREIAQLHPEKRFFPVENGNATGVAIRTNLLADVSAVIGDPDGKGGYTLRLYWNPLVPWIWLGAAAMALGGIVSLTDRRHRVGAPARRRRELAAATVQAAE